jgi:hypothetical protein
VRIVTIVTDDRLLAMQGIGEMGASIRVARDNGGARIIDQAQFTNRCVERKWILQNTLRNASRALEKWCQVVFLGRKN